MAFIYDLLKGYLLFRIKPLITLKELLIISWSIDVSSLRILIVEIIIFFDVLFNEIDSQLRIC